MKCGAVRLYTNYLMSRWVTTECVRKGWFHLKHRDAQGVTWYGRIGN